MPRLVRLFASVLLSSLILPAPAKLAAQKAAPPPPAPALSPAANSAFQDALNHAQNDPDFDYEAASDNIIAHSQPGDAQGINDAISQLKDAAAKAKKARDDDSNASGFADWNLGLLYRGTKYNVKFPLTNKCKVPVTVILSYPSQIPLTGPDKVTVGPKSKTDVAMTIDLTGSSWTQSPTGPDAWLFNWACVPKDDSLWMMHLKVPGGTKVTPAGTWTYVCPSMVRAFSMHTHYHWRPPPDPNGGGGGGGGGKPKKPSRPACYGLWLTGEFFSQAGAQTAAACRPDLAAEMETMIQLHVRQLQQQYPKDWLFLPSTSIIESMSTEGLLALKSEILTTARAEVFGPGQ